VLRRGGGDARQPKDLFRFCLIILNYFALQNMAINFYESEAYSIAETLLHTHVAQQHVHGAYLKVEIIRGHAWWKEGVQELFWDYLRMVFSLNDVIINAVSHVASSFHHAKNLVIKQGSVLVGWAQDYMISEIGQSVLIQNISKCGVDEGQTVVNYTYVPASEVNSIITNSIPNI
jgi:hypothetical protein